MRKAKANLAAVAFFVVCAAITPAWVSDSGAATIIERSDGLEKDTKDTPEDVMQAGKNGVEGINNLMSLLKDAQAVSAHMARDKEHAAKVLELARRNDRAGLAALFKKDAPNSQIEILEIKDFTIKAMYKRSDGVTVIVCVSNSKGCNGRNFVLLA